MSTIELKNRQDGTTTYFYSSPVRPHPLSNWPPSAPRIAGGQNCTKARGGETTGTR